MKAKVGAIFLVSVLAIAGAGAAYALWFEDLYIYTDIYTGTVDVEWSYRGWDSTEWKDVSILDASIDGDTLWCWMENVYPCIEYYFLFDIHCVGSIPVHFTPLEVIGGSLDLDWIDDYGIYITDIFDEQGELLTHFEIPELIQYIQLHEGWTAWGYYMIHFNNFLPQDDYFTLDWTTMAHQYNELDWGPQ